MQPSDNMNVADTEPVPPSPEDSLSPLTLAQANQDAHAPIERVIDVPLTVTLRFGQRQVTLRELLQLNTGSLVELDQKVEDPVHLMLGDRVIARGEVVIVDGNYGMRVLEVIEHAAVQRLNALGVQ
jgi:flagellar motor switch protein FliN